VKSNTPRTDACPHCGDKYDGEKFFRYECGTLQKFPNGTIRTELCHQTEVSNIWQKRAEKAEDEAGRLRLQLKRSVWIADEFWNNQKQAVLIYHQELADELAKLREQS